MTEETAQQRYRRLNPERVKASKRKYYLKIRERDREKRQQQVQAWRDKNPGKHAEHNRKSRAKNPRNGRARGKLKAAVARGEITKPNKCSECKEVKLVGEIQGHHEDHRKWRDVIWLCSGCHGKRHRKYKEAS